MFYVIYDDKPAKEFHVFVTDDVRAWDEESIEFGKTYLMGIKSSNVSGLFNDDEEFFIFYPTSEGFDPNRIKSFTSWNSEFQEAVELIIDAITEESKMRHSVEAIFSL